MNGAVSQQGRRKQSINTHTNKQTNRLMSLKNDVSTELSQHFKRQIKIFFRIEQSKYAENFYFSLKFT